MLREKEALADLEEAENAKRRVTGVLDPITSKLTDYGDANDLIRKIDTIFIKLDADCAGGLDFYEFKQGIQRLPGSRIDMTQDDFAIITEYGHLSGANGQFNKQQFRVMMQNELFRYARRGLSNVLTESRNDEFKQSVLMLKMIETNLVSKIGDQGYQVSLCNEAGRDNSTSFPAEREGLHNAGRMCKKLEGDVKIMEQRIQARLDEIVNDIIAKHELVSERNGAHFRTLFELLSAGGRKSKVTTAEIDVVHPFEVL